MLSKLFILLSNFSSTASTAVSYTHLSLDDLFQLMKSQSHELNVKFDEKFNEMKNEIKKQIFKFDKRIDEIEIRCDNIQKQTIETVNEKFNIKINNLDNRIDKINETVNETVQNQIET